MKNRRKTRGIRLLAWVLAFVLMVPWNVLAEGGASPDNSAAVKTEEEEVEFITENGDVGTRFLASDVMGPYTVTFCKENPDGSDVPTDNVIKTFEGVDAGTSFLELVEELLKFYPAYAYTFWTVAEDYAIVEDLTVWAVQEGQAASVDGAVYGSLQEAVDHSEGKTVHLLRDVSENIVSSDQSFTMDLGGHTVTAQDSAKSVITLKGGAVTIKNGRITGGHLSGYNNGGGIKVSNGELTVEKLTIQDNSARRGGGIYVAGAAVSTLTVKDGCRIGRNRASNMGGGIFFEGKQFTVLADFYLEENSAGSGAGICVYAGDAAINDTTFIGNAADRRGGAIDVATIDGELLTANNCTFMNNTASNGAVVYDYHGGKLILNACSISGNISTDGAPLELVVPDNLSSVAKSDGRGSIELNSCRIEGNKGGRSGGIQVEWGCSALLADTVVTGNIGGETGGILAVWRNDSVEVTGTGAIYDNYAESAEGLINHDLRLRWSSSVSIFRADYMTDGANGGKSFSSYWWNSFQGTHDTELSGTYWYDGAWDPDDYYCNFYAGEVSRKVAQYTDDSGTDCLYKYISDAVQSANRNGKTRRVKLIAGMDGSSRVIAQTVDVTADLSAGSEVEIDMNGRTIQNNGTSITIAQDQKVSLLGETGGAVISRSDAYPYALLNHGSLVIDAPIRVTGIEHDGTSLELGPVEVANLKLGKDHTATALNGFAPNNLTVEVDADTLEALNGKGSKGSTPDEAVLIRPAEGVVLTDAFAESITVRSADALVYTCLNEKGEVVARRRNPAGIFLGGTGSSDENDGRSADAPVKSFEKAKEIYEGLSEDEKKSIDGIYVVGTVKVDSEEEWSLGKDLEILRYPLFTGTMAEVSGSLTLRNIVLDGMSGLVTAVAPIIQVNGSGKLEIKKGAELRNNRRTNGYGGAIYSNGGAVKMSGGMVACCQAMYGGGIGLEGSACAMDMQGGTVSDNVALHGGGGIAVLESASLTLSGSAAVSENEAKTGGGISIGGETTTTVGEGNGILVMKGGSVSGNISQEEGGGIYIQSHNKATVTAGSIIGNESKGGDFCGGGGIYVNGARSGDGKDYACGELWLENAEITGNSADVYGGGYAGCSTSTTYFYQEQGATVYGNTADAANEVYIDNGSSPFSAEVFISPYTKEGELYQWEGSDGLLLSDNMLQAGSVLSIGDYRMENSVTGGEGAAVQITGNIAVRRGGGIGNNGFVQIGGAGGENVTVTKEWRDDDDKNGLRPESVTVWLLQNGKRAEYRVMREDENGNWKAAFTDLPSGYIYTVEEETSQEMAESYADTVSSVEGETNCFIITNVLMSDLIVSKNTVNTVTPANGKTDEFIFAIELTDQDGKAYSGKLATMQGDKEGEITFGKDGKAQVTLKDGESIRIKEIPLGTAYTVTEETAGGYAARVSENEADERDTDTVSGTIGIGVQTVVFTNTYKVDSTTEKITGRKELTGRAWTDADKFTFELSETTTGDVADKLMAARTAEATSAAQKFDFGTLTYTAPGEHTYTVKETSVSDSGVTVDDTVYTVIVSVTDNGDGTLSVSKTIRKNADASGSTAAGAGVSAGTAADAAGSTAVGIGASAGTVADAASGIVQEIVFTNRYTTGTVSETITGRKELTGRDWTATDKFTFELAETTTGDVADKLTAARTAEATSAAQKFDFGTLTYTAPGEHTYAVKETSVSGSGVTVDDTVYTVTVVVTDNGDGTLSTSKTIRKNADASGSTAAGAGASAGTAADAAGSTAVGAGASAGTVADAASGIVKEIVFTNRYTTGTVSETITGRKELAGRDWTDADKFTFELAETTTGSVADKLTAARTAEATSAAKAFDFGTLTYTAPGEHTYAVKETSVSGNGITVDDTVYTVTVVVTDYGDGTLSTSKTIRKNADASGSTAAGAGASAGTAAEAIVFTNSYTSSGTLALTGTKVLIGNRKETLSDGEFQFTVRENGREVSTGSAKADGSIAFAEIAYSLADVGTHAYEISEIPGSEEGMEYSQKVYSVKVTVADQGDGTLEVQAEYPEGGLLFENKFETESGLSLHVTKRLMDLSGHSLGAEDATFYVALFADEARTMRVTEVKEVHFVNSSEATADFENLADGMTYYLGETDRYGTLMISGVEGNTVFEPVYEGAFKVMATKAVPEQEAAFANEFSEIPSGFYRSGEITVTKKVLKGGEAYATEETFYAAAFEDAAHTVRASEAVAIAMDGRSEASAVIPVSVGNSEADEVTYYVTETDEDGNALDPFDPGLEFTVSVDRESVTMSFEATAVSVEITNTYPEDETELETETESETETEAETETETETEEGTEPETETETETQTEKLSEKETEKQTEKQTEPAAKTGDETPILPFTAMLFAAAVVLLGGVYRRRKAWKR